MPTYGYIRVSTREQNEDRQLNALREISIPEENIFMDKQSGKDFNRPQYKKLMKYRSSGGFSPKRKKSTLWCWICPYWTPVGVRT